MPVSLRSNLVANYLGQGWTALMGLLFVPLYIHYLGLESYGLIGVFAVLQAGLTLLDLGMSPTLNRELARYTAGAHSPGSVGDLVRTFEFICAGLALVILVGATVAAGWIARTWLNASALSPERVTHVLMIMGVVAALRFQEGLYRAAILGFQRHVWLNLASASLATLRGVGAVLVLLCVETSIEVFFIWQAAISMLTVAILRWQLLRYMPTATRQARFVPADFGESWHFAKGILLTTVLALVLTQIDKVLLSRLLSLEQFGVYAFATSIVGMLAQLIGPVTQSYSPKFAQLVASQDETTLVSSYHQAAQLMSIVLVPAGLTLGLYAEPLILAWSGNASLAVQAAPIVAMLALGTVLNSFMQVPYMLQLAYGWSMLSVRVNVLAVALIVPILLLLVPKYGAVGAAMAWGAVNCFYIAVGIHFMHRRLLVTEKWHWYVRDVLLPFSVAVVVALIGRWMLPVGINSLLTLAFVFGAAAATFVAAMIVTDAGRTMVLRFARICAM